ncbi:MAG: hypothetical protein HKN88_08555 [Gammaproteobacteria bacterium]|nr:hypothetical protein [Gammaproteobacteria bacterium]NNC98109.1 hypothetical protein [Gammaproteobacteria bacterium]NNM13173.1 hypothetical protein [Gammaproteobacteria bacterium]
MTNSMLFTLLVILSLGYCLQPVLVKKPDNSSKTRIVAILSGLLGLAGIIFLFQQVKQQEAVIKPTGKNSDTQQALAEAQNNPGSVEKWNALGRKLILEREYLYAYLAYSESQQLDQFAPLTATKRGSRIDWLTGLAESRILARQGAIDEDSYNLIEQASELAENNPKVLWYGGLAAAQRGNTQLAKQRWELLLRQNPPQALQNVVIKRLDSLWEMKLEISLAPELVSQSQAQSRIFLSLRQPETAPPVVAKSLSINDLNKPVNLDYRNTIAQMSDKSQLNWDKPVSLSIIWSPQGSANAAGNIKRSQTVTREQLKSALNVEITAAE